MKALLKELTTLQKMLELAAEAAGINIVQRNGIFVRCGDDINPPLPWEPLDNSEDAFELAVICKIDILFGPYSVEAIANTGNPECEPFGIMEYGDNQLAATRRAIVRCAAQIQLAKEDNV